MFFVKKTLGNTPTFDWLWIENYDQEPNQYLDGSEQKSCFSFQTHQKL